MNEKIPLTKRDYLYSHGFLMAYYIGILCIIYNNEISFFANLFITFFITLAVILVGYFIGLSQLLQALFMISCEILFFTSKLIFKIFKKLYRLNKQAPKQLPSPKEL
ncbi:hypothetical protein EX128_02595 [Campylobacter jejuni]|nr:hypothetical protein [Campylobacter jejuni]OEW12172.1 hypothetical protein AJ934_00910 [Campylobacter sp. BCW_6875]OEW38024.1 hypothetical protein AJ881_01115 [Campylobacter sp. BCW_6460]EAH9335687.1 hypothetical protein [Campylobacter jejuni]EAJ4373668.1 hypothetical protein [Campylobacter jejuni]